MKIELISGHDGEYVSLEYPYGVDVTKEKNYLRKLKFGNSDNCNIEMIINESKLYIGYSTFVEGKFDLAHVISFDNINELHDNFDNAIPEFVDQSTFLSISKDYDNFEKYIDSRGILYVNDNVDITSETLSYLVYRCICREQYLDSNPVIIAVPDNEEYTPYCLGAIKKIINLTNVWITKMFSFATNASIDSDCAICFKKRSLINDNSRNVIFLDQKCDYNNNIEYLKYYDLARNLISDHFWDFVDGVIPEDISVSKMSEISDLYQMRNEHHFDEILLEKLNQTFIKCTYKYEKQLYRTVLMHLVYNKVLTQESLNSALLRIDNVSFDNVLGLKQYGRLLQYLSKSKMEICSKTLKILYRHACNDERACGAEFEKYIKEIECERNEYNNILGEERTNKIIDHMNSALERIKEMEEINRLKAELETVESENNQLKSDKAKLNNQVEELKNNLEKLHNKIEIEIRDKNILENDFEKLKAEFKKQSASNSNNEPIVIKKVSDDNSFASKKPLIIAIICLSAVVLVLIGLLLGKLIFGGKKDKPLSTTTSTTEGALDDSSTPFDATETDASTDVETVTVVSSATDADDSENDTTNELEDALAIWQEENYSDAKIILDGFKSSEIMDILSDATIDNQIKEMLIYHLMTSLITDIDDEIYLYEISDIDIYSSSEVYDVLKNYVYIGDVDSFTLINFLYDDENYIFYFNGRNFRRVEDEMELATDIDADEWLYKSDIEEMLLDDEEYDIHYGNLDVELFIEVFQAVE